jgi:hypothetical protein
MNSDRSRPTTVSTVLFLPFASALSLFVDATTATAAKILPYVNSCFPPLSLSNAIF